MECEQEEVVRPSGDRQASILIARTGSGLFASGVMARWGNGGTCMEPGVGSVPYDTEPEARRAAYRELIQTLEAAGGTRQGTSSACCCWRRWRKRIRIAGCSVDA